MSCIDIERQFSIVFTFEALLFSEYAGDISDSFQLGIICFRCFAMSVRKKSAIPQSENY
jgi:hypothetical protein